MKYTCSVIRDGYVRPAIRKQPGTRTGRPVLIRPKSKNSFFFSPILNTGRRKNPVSELNNRTDSGRPKQVLDAFASEIQITANPIFRARLEYSMFLYYVSKYI